MKFDNDSYFFKHSNCLDVFIVVNNVVMDTGEVAIIWVNWMIQGTEHYWEASNNERIKVTKEEYSKWISYTPKGKYYGT